MGKLSGEYDHVWSDDPALVTTVTRQKCDKDGKPLTANDGSPIMETVANPAFDFQGWIDRGDDALLCIREGEKPHRFTLRHLTGRARIRLEDLIDQSGGEATREVMYEACSLALVRWALGTSNGVPDACRRVVERKVERVAEDVMESLYAVHGGSLVWELGLRAIQGMAPDPKP